MTVSRIYGLNVSVPSIPLYNQISMSNVTAILKIRHIYKSPTQAYGRINKTYTFTYTRHTPIKGIHSLTHRYTCKHITTPQRTNIWPYVETYYLQHHPIHTNTHLFNLCFYKPIEDRNHDDGSLTPYPKH